MLKSLFFKPKVTDELLPPPPPFPSMDLEEKAPLNQEIISEGSFDDLFKDLEEKSLKKSKDKKKAGKEPEFEDDILDELFKGAVKETKFKPKKRSKKSAKPKAMKIDEIEFPEILENLDVDSEIAELTDEPRKRQVSDEEKEIMDAIKEAKSDGKKGLIGLLKQKLTLTRKKRLETETKVYDNIEQEAAPLSSSENIQKKIDEARGALMDFNLNKAKSLYFEIMGIYNNMNPEDKAKVYNDIMDLYSERKSAEQLKI